MKTDALEKIYGLILTSSINDGLGLFNRIDPDWNITRFHKTIYKTIEAMLREGQEVNLLTLVNAMKSGKDWDKSYIGKISSLTSQLSHLDHFNSSIFFLEMEFENTRRKATLFLTKLNGSISADNFNPNEYRNWLQNELDGSLSKQIETRNNIEIVFDVLNSHSRAKAGEQSGLELGYSVLNRVVLLEPVDMMVVGARPAMGKTAFAISTAIKCAFQQNLKVGLFALEMSAEQVMRRIIANVASVDSNRIKYGECNDYELSKIYKVQEMPELANITIYEGAHTIKQIVSAVSGQKAAQGIDLVIVDYLQKITPMKDSSRFDIVSGASNGLKSMAQSLHVPVLALAQLSRDSSKLGKRPSLPDLRESGDIEQDASIVGFIHRPEYYGEPTMENGESSEGMAEFIIGKNREGDVGIYPMKVSLKTSKFMDCTFDNVIPAPAPAVAENLSLNFIRNNDENPF